MQSIEASLLKSDMNIYDVMTPDGLDIIHLRQPVLLKYLFRLCGSHIEQTVFFNKHMYSEDQQKTNDDKEY